MQQPDNEVRDCFPVTSRLRLPEDFAAFRPDLGPILRQIRQGKRMTQQQAADIIGIQRTSLSALENGKSQPMPDTLDGFMNAYEITLFELLIPGPNPRVSRPTDVTLRCNQRADLGRTLREVRKAKKMSLREVAALCDLSAAQLSRVERGEALYSRAFEDEPADTALPRDYRGLRLRHPALRMLIGGDTREN